MKYSESGDIVAVNNIQKADFDEMFASVSLLRWRCSISALEGTKH